MGLARQVKAFAGLLLDKKRRNALLDLLERRRQSELSEDTRSQYKNLAGKRIYFIGGCDILFIKESFDSLGCETYLTFDHGRTSDPLSEVMDESSPIWDFRPDYILLSQVQLVRGSIEKLQTEGLKYTHDQQTTDLAVLRSNYESAIEKLREKGITAPIFLFGYPLVYRPAHGIHEYKSLKQGRSLVEYLLTYDLGLYQIARDRTSVYVLDVNLALEGSGKRHITKDHNANGIYEHLERKPSAEIAENLMYQMTTLDPAVPRVKCAVFDLDDTLWKGVLREDGPEGVSVRENYLMVMRLLLNRGILLAICSKNDEVEMEHLPDLVGADLASRIVAKKLNWLPKSQNLREIAEDLNIGVDSLAFFDDNPRERAEVQMNEPRVMVYSDQEILSCLNRVEFEPFGEISEVALSRTDKYLTEQKRKNVEREYSGKSYEEYLKSCQLKIEMRRPNAGELSRVHELLSRTNQMNATLKRTSLEDIKAIFSDPDRHGIWIARLEDRFGDFGLIGAVAANKASNHWEITELAFSCRAMGKGVEMALLNQMAREAVTQGVEDFRLEFVPTERNGQMLKILTEIGFQTGNGEIAGSEGKALDLVRKLATSDINNPAWLQEV